MVASREHDRALKEELDGTETVGVLANSGPGWEGLKVGGWHQTPGGEGERR
jgi:hypothetical protein